MTEPRYKITTPAIDLPVSLQELKSNVRVSNPALDGVLLQHLQGATAEAESYTGRLFMRATVAAYLDSYPEDGELEITKGPVNAITSVKYYADGESTMTTVDSGKYQLDNIEVDARLRFSEVFTADANRMNAVEIIYTAGWATAEEVPRQIREAIILSASARYLNPLAGTMPVQARYLLDAYKNKRF